MNTNFIPVKTSVSSLPSYHDYADSFEHRIGSIVQPERAHCVIALSVLSGFVSTLALWTSNAPCFWWGPGIAFGVIVMLPWCRWCRLSWLQTAMTLVLAPLAYFASVACALEGVTLLAGLVGSTILFAPLMFCTHPLIRSSLCAAGAAGWLLGLLFALPFLAYFGGIAVWQIGVAAFLSTAVRVDDA